MPLASCADPSEVDMTSFENAEPSGVGGEDATDMIVDGGVAPIENTGVVETEDDSDTVAPPLLLPSIFPLFIRVIAKPTRFAGLDAALVVGLLSGCESKISTCRWCASRAAAWAL